MNPLLAQAIRSGHSRRDFLRNLLFAAGSVSTASWLSACGSSSPLNSVAAPGRSRFADIGPLQAPDANGIQLPAGFTSRVVAVAGEAPVPGSSFVWHRDPDGAGSFALPDGGWLYVSNAEVRDATSGGLIDPLQPILSRETVAALGLLRGGASALRFAADGTLVDAYTILHDTTTNCSGTATPWGTWICGEEIADGYMFECDPLGTNPAGRRLDLFGRFGHEQVAIDVAGRAIYHTEDFGGDDRFYRNVFTETDWPAGGRPAFNDGALQALVVEGGVDAARNGPAPIRWVDVINDGRPQRQVYLPETTIFSGNEGVWFLKGFVFFSSKGDNNIWAIDTIGNTIESIYSPESQPIGSPVDPNEPPLQGVDNLCMTDDGEMIVVEDGGDMRAMVLLPDRTVVPLLRLPDETGGSEVTGPAFSPDGRRFYCSAQRNGRNGASGNGVTFEITMPFPVRVTRPLAGA
ncbi:MAG: alkaline phosphatase PhoX [Sinimarinibacterium flocculans]|uniref:alkaline phosphatase PhoX n=1 Tax=Sinimarinibacterium flocculans TaxID=985250 RepID=UPI003C363D72